MSHITVALYAFPVLFRGAPLSAISALSGAFAFGKHFLLVLTMGSW